MLQNLQAVCFSGTNGLIGSREPCRPTGRGWPRPRPSLKSKSILSRLFPDFVSLNMLSTILVTAVSVEILSAEVNQIRNSLQHYKNYNVTRIQFDKNYNVTRITTRITMCQEHLVSSNSDLPVV